MIGRLNRGFTLVEFVIAIVFLGVVLGPFLLFVARIHDLDNAIGQQARRESSRSWSDQALALGLDPSSAAGFAPKLNAATPLAPMPQVAADDVPAIAGLARIVPLHTVLDDTVAESRLAGAGYQIGPGAPLAPRSVPTPPLIPVLMPSPLINPADGSVIAATSLTGSPNGLPYTTDVTATSIAGATVTLVFNQPSAVAQGIGSARRTITAVELLNSVDGSTWTEYSGDPLLGDRPTILGDGRTRWFVTRADHRTQIYEPSLPAHFAFRIGLGAPVVVYGATEASSGTNLDFDYAAYQKVQDEKLAVRIDFPAMVKSAFGSSWGTLTVGYQWTFGDQAGPFAGNMDAFFQADMLAGWNDSVPVKAVPVVPRGALADDGRWTFVRTKTALAVPIMSSAGDRLGFFAPGQLQFTAPPGPDGSPVGRLSFENGANVSTGSTLAISVAP